MPLSPPQPLTHAHAVRARGTAMPPDGMPSADILDSWVRCMQAGLDSAAPSTIPVVEAANLAQRRQRAEGVRRLARAELETLAQQIAGSNFLLAFADQDGVVLDLYADNRFAMSGANAGILPGSFWRESLCGTTGLATALAAGRPVAVTGLEHYALQLGAISCTAAPVRDAAGAIVGVLDASSYFDSRQRHTLALVQMAATHIENGLLAQQMREHIVLAVHPRPEFLGTLNAGLLAFSESGQLMALNARGRQLLSGQAAAPGAAFEALFGEPFEHLLARLHRGDEMRLRDVLGNTLVASCVNRWAERQRAPLPATARLASLAVALPVTLPAAVPVALPAATAVSLAAALPDASPAGWPADFLPISAAAATSTRRRRAAPGVPLAGAGAAHEVADDPAVADAYRLVEAAVRLKAPILILGETGSGKELLARHAHRASGRSGAFVAVNCGALPAELFEAELFGYVGGAFTGARREGSIGLIASADGGTLLLDEVRELPLQLQAGLLRFLDDQVVRPVGGTSARRVDVQLLAATHAALDDEVAARRFRADLLYRLNTVSAALPPLRQRRDFAAAALSVLATLDAGATLTDAALQRLAQHAWPGNFRELRSVLTRALLGRQDGHLDAPDMHRLLPAATAAPAGAASVLKQDASERVRLEWARCDGSVSQVSRNLGISRTTVYRHLRDLQPVVSSR